MSNDGSQGGSNSEVPEVSSRYVPYSDDIVVHIRRVREFAPLLFSATVGSIFVEDWTRVMSQNLKVLSVPKSLKVRIACLFLRENPLYGLSVQISPECIGGINLGFLWRGTLRALVLIGRGGW